MKKQIFNPYLPSWEYVPDGEPRVFDNRLYVYGSHDYFNGKDFCLGDYVGWSAPIDDLSDWRCEGVIYRKNQDPRNKKGKMHMCAPDCVKGIDGRYYLYYQLHALQCTSVAVSNSPSGPFEFYGYVRHKDGKPWGEKKGDTFAFDPGVLVDNNKVYLYVGFAPVGFMRSIFKMRGNKVDGSVCLELEEDMITVKSEEYEIVPGPLAAKGTAFEGHAFFEASSIRKINDKYYYVYSSELSHELCYAVSDRPTGGFRYGGTLISIADIGYKGNNTPINYTGNTHGGMVNMKGQWYIFYHRQTNKLKCNRQGAAEKIDILKDGSIKQVEVTSCGLNNAPLCGRGKYGARIACNLSGKDGIIKSDNARKLDKKNLLPYFTQSGEDREDRGDQYIANMRDGSWCGFKYFDFDGKEDLISITLRGKGNGNIKIYFNLKDNPIAIINVSNSEEWKDYTSKIKTVNGVKPLYFLYEGNEYIDLLQFEIK